jgi:hypothetical protein
VLVALLAAIVGGILTIGGDIATRLVFERRLKEALLRDVWREVDQLEELCKERVRPSQGMRLLAPLPTGAWQAAKSSRALGRLAAEQRTTLLQVYGKVEAANYLADQGATLFAIAQLADEEIVERLEIEAHKLTSDPYQPVLDEIAAAQARR